MTSGWWVFFIIFILVDVCLVVTLVMVLIRINRPSEFDKAVAKHKSGDHSECIGESHVIISRNGRLLSWRN